VRAINSASLAILAAIRRASSRVISESGCNSSDSLARSGRTANHVIVDRCRTQPSFFPTRDYLLHGGVEVVHTGIDGPC
jgi:hypothetical protein